MRKHGCTAALAALALVGAPGVAGALGLGGEGPHPFVMPDLALRSRAGMDLTVGRLGGAFLDDLTVVTFDLIADVALAPGWALFGRLPLAHASSDQDSGTALGNLTGGVRFARPLAGTIGSELLLGAEASLSLPTASDEGQEGATALVATLLHAPHDPGRYAPNSTTLRTAGNLRVAGGPTFFQAQLGLDLLFVDGSTGDDPQLLRLGLAGGLRLGPAVAAIVELTTLGDLGGDGGLDDEFVHSLDLGVRYDGLVASAGARLYLPLDEAFRDLDMVGLGLEVAARF